MSGPASATAHAGTGLRVDLAVGGRITARFEAEPGAVVAVIGPNGAGKSTLLRALSGTQPHTGSITLGTTSWTDPPVLTRHRSVGCVFQDPLLFPHLTARANVAFGPRARGMTKTEADRVAMDWLARFGVGDLADRRPGELSGGQAQRVAIARALAGDPALLLLDEPFAGLDVGVAAALRIELSRHLATYDGVTLLVTHDALDAMTLATRVLVLDGGRIVQEGAPSEVAARPLTDHVARLVGLNVHRDGDALAAFSPSTVTVSLGEPEGSARHRWHGSVQSLAPHGDAVRVLVDAGEHLLADVTPAAAAELGLIPGRLVWLSVKETAVTWYPAGPSHPGPAASGE